MQIPKKYANDFSQGIEVEKNSGHMKCTYKIIDRQISIKVLWESFYPNILSKDKQTLGCVYYLLGLIHNYLSCPLTSSHVCMFFRLKLASQSLIWDSR